MNTSDAITTEGFLFISNQIESCTLHVVQDPQSASASITKSLSSAIRRRNSSGAGFGEGWLAKTLDLHAGQAVLQMLGEPIDQDVAARLGDIEQRHPANDRARA